MNNSISNSELEITNTIFLEADDLAAEYEGFHNNFIVAGRTALYQSLGKIYALAQKLDHSVDKREQIVKMRNILSEKYDIRTQENTSDVAVLVRYITRTDRKTTHVYARAIETAKANAIPAAEFSKFLEQAGGVERIRADGVLGNEGENGDHSKLLFEEKLDLTRRYLDARREYPATTFTLDEKQAMQFGGHISNFGLALCAQKDGRYQVLAKIPADLSLEKRAVEILAHQLPDDLSSVRKNVDRFYVKAMEKRASNTLKGLIKKRPELAAGVLRINRIRNLVVQSNKGE